MATIISHFGDDLAPKLKETYSILVGRLGQDAVMVASLEAWGQIAGSKLKINLSGCANDVAKQLTAILRKVCFGFFLV